MSDEIPVVTGGEWRTTTLGAIADFLSGGTPSKANPAYWNGDMPWLSAKDMKSLFIYDTEDHLTATGSENGTRIVPASTIFILTRGMTLLNDIPICVAKCTMTFNQDVKAIRARSGVSSDYLAYLLLSRKPQLLGMVDLAGHGTGRLNSDSLKALEVTIPESSEEQRAIAGILRALDDKIELNRRTNETIGSITRALFKSWFMDFDGVASEDMQESEFGLIPKEWQVMSFGDIAQQGKGTIKPGDSPDDTFTHYSLPAFDDSQIPVVERGEAIKSNKTPVPGNSLLISKLNPHIPRIWLVGDAGEHAVCSTEFIVWTPKSPANNAFLYCLASSSEFNSSMRQLVTGTSNSHQRVKPDQIANIRTFAASEAAISSASRAMKPLMEKVLHNREESATLSSLRDTLLPKLLSGELRVTDAERMVENA